MLKVYIKMDEEKIRQDGVYAVEDILYTIDKTFERLGLVKGENGFYLERGTKDDFAHFWSIILGLSKEDWFMDNVKEWLWFDSNNGHDESDFTVDDLAEHYRRKRQLERKSA